MLQIAVCEGEQNHITSGFRSETIHILLTSGMKV